MAFATYEKHGRVATVTMNKPESRNAIGTQADCDELAEALWRANDDGDINAVILTGAGKAFCAGGDLKAIRERTGIGPRGTPDGTRANYRRAVHTIIKALAEVLSQDEATEQQRRNEKLDDLRQQMSQRRQYQQQRRARR